MLRIFLFVSILHLVFTPLASAQKTTLLPDAQLNAISQEASGSLAKDTIIALGRLHRVQAAAGFHQAAVHIADKAREYGLQEVQIESFPADGRTTYNSFRAYLGWEATTGILKEISPREEVIADYNKMPVALADYSNDADITAQLIDVGTGLKEGDYANKDVKGKIVLAGGNVAVVHKEAVEKRGAAGILSYQPNQVTGWSGDYLDNVRWGHLSPYKTSNTFAFMISLRQARIYQARLASGELIRLQAMVKARMQPGNFEVVSAIIPGTDKNAGEIVYSCHLCHQKPGANDNASGAATILEDARILMALIKQGKLAPPRRTIRFIWPPEIAGTACYFARHPDIVQNMRAAIHMDMVGGNHQITKAIFHLTHTPASIPSYVNDVVAVFGEYVINGSRRAAMEGDFSDALLSPDGTKEVMVADFAPFSMGSDHDVYQEGSYRIPTIYMNDWPDVFIHTNNDTPANIDATKLQRVAVIGATSGYFLASADAQATEILAGEVFARGGMRQNEALRRALALVQASTAKVEDLKEAHNIITQAAAQERQALASIAELATPRNAILLDNLIKNVSVREMEAKSLLRTYKGNVANVTIATEYSQVAQRNVHVKGNMNVYYYDYIEDHLTTPLPAELNRLSERPNGEILIYETLNLVDGKRSVAEIRDILSAAYGKVPADAVLDYLKLLEKAGVLTLTQH